MNRKLLFLAVLGLLGLSAQSQLNIDGATFFISSGATVTVQGDVTSNVSIQGTGLLQMKSTGVAQNLNMGGNTIPNLEIDNANNVNMLAPATISTNMLFTTGKVQLNGFDLTMGAAGTISGVSNARYVITNGAGQLMKNGLTGAYLFPVGFSGTEFNPVTITNAGTSDNYGVRTLTNVLANGTSGSPVAANFASNSWVITEAVAGGSNLTLSGEWAAADELPGFNRNKSGIARYNSGTDWDLPASNVIAAAGSGPYSRSRAGVTNTGVFAIADAGKVNRATVDLKIFLQGAYTGTAGTAGGLMRDNYRSSGSIPSTQPYGGGKFQHLGVEGGTETFNPAILATTGNNAIVDWVFVTLLDPATPSTRFQTRAALLQRDGDVVDMDGVSPLSIPINSDGNYLISVGHRNHLSARLPNASPVNMVESAVIAPSWDFTTAGTQAYTNGAITTNASMNSVTTSGITRFCLIAGNTDGIANTGSNGRTVIYSGSGNDRGAILASALGGNPSATLSITPANYVTMARYDINMNGTVVYSGSGNDPAIILTVLGGNVSITAQEHQ